MRSGVMKSGSLVIEGGLVYRPYDEDDPCNTDRTEIGGERLDEMLASFNGRNVRITVELLPVSD